MNRSLFFTMVLSLTAVTSQAAQLIVVEDKGGVSALSYYRSLNPEPSSPEVSQNLKIPNAIAAQGLPVRSTRMTPGTVQGRAINAPGLQPLFLIGDDETSRLWLQKHGTALQQMQAVGLVVNVASLERLALVRAWIPNVQISPVSGDDLAQRLGLSHYPVLITPTAIEQ